MIRFIQDSIKIYDPTSITYLSSLLTHLQKDFLEWVSKRFSFSWITQLLTGSKEKYAHIFQCDLSNDYTVSIFNNRMLIILTKCRILFEYYKFRGFNIISIIIQLYKQICYFLIEFIFGIIRIYFLFTIGLFLKNFILLLLL